MDMNLFGYVLKLFGWKVIGFFPDSVKKAVIIAAPHTSNWDFVLGWMAYKSLDVRAKYLMKKEIFFFPLGVFLKRMGAIPVDRLPGNNVVEEIVNSMKSIDDFILTITPEGTRSKVENWKDGFYRICRQAEVPLFLAKIDFNNKEIGLIGEFALSGDYESDLQEIKQNYSASMAKHPENY